MHAGGNAAPSGSLNLKVIRGDGTVEEIDSRPRLVTPSLELLPSLPLRPLEMREIALHSFPRNGLPDEVNEWRTRNLRHLQRGLRRVAMARALRLPSLYGQLRLAKLCGDGQVLDFGVVSLRVVTTAGVGFIVDAFQNLTELENLKFHGFGTGGAAEAVGNTALTTELTTEYAVNSTRPTGTTTESAANIYRTVATLSPDANVAITEHGVFDQAATGGGTLLDRTLFSVINLVGSADSLQATYDLTLTAGS